MHVCEFCLDPRQAAVLITPKLENALLTCSHGQGGQSSFDLYPLPTSGEGLEMFLLGW